MDLTEYPYLIPLFVPLFFIGLWLFISALFAFGSGWWSLARRFRAAARPEGQEVVGQVKKMGLLRENRITHLIVSESGLYLYPSLLFRFLHPALLIPWSRVGQAQKIKTLWWHTYSFDLDSTTSMSVTEDAYQAMRRYKA